MPRITDATGTHIPDATWTKRVIEWQEIGAEAIWSDALANPIEMSMMRDVAIRGVKVMFRSYVAAGGPAIGHMETPDTWWDHWKVEHPRLTSWLVWLIPPHFRYVEYEFFARICPHLLQPVGGEGECQHVLWVSDAATPTDD